MKRVLCAALLLFASPATRAAAPVQSPLPSVVVTELKALDETYALLDSVALKIWPGWTAYREPPFMFTFENGIRVLVGHPNPPKEFLPIPDLRVGGRPVTVDRTKETAVPMTGPLAGGGGPISFGMTATGEPVEIVDIKLGTVRETDKKDEEWSPSPTEDKILIYLHELFHCFQRGRLEPRFGNLMYNADADYATWSNVEGVALERAYAETDRARAMERMKDFVVARSLKRRNMTEEQANEESADDVREGTATYAMVRALEIIKAGGFTPRLTTAEDPGYRRFADVDRMLAQYPQKLKKTAARHEDPKMKCYDYGCFQALMCERLFAGWQQMAEKGQFIDAVVGAKLPMTADERQAIEQRLATDYPVAAIRAEATTYTTNRDEAYRKVQDRQGRVYIVDLKPTGRYLSGLAEQKGSYRLGLMQLFPDGYPGFTLDQVVVSKVGAPSMVNEIYYVRVVDTEWKSRKQAYTVSGSRQADGTYLNAIVTTPLFTVKAPKVRVKETGNRVKIQILARVAPTT